MDWCRFSKFSGVSMVYQNTCYVLGNGNQHFTRMCTSTVYDNSDDQICTIGESNRHKQGTVSSLVNESGVILE